MSLKKAENPQTLKEVMFGPYAEYVREELKDLMKLLDIVDDFQRYLMTHNGQRHHVLINIQRYHATIEERINLLIKRFAVFSDPDILREYIDTYYVKKPESVSKPTAKVSASKHEPTKRMTGCLVRYFSAEKCERSDMKLSKYITGGMHQVFKELCEDIKRNGGDLNNYGVLGPCYGSVKDIQVGVSGKVKASGELPHAPDLYENEIDASIRETLEELRIVPMKEAIEHRYKANCSFPGEKWGETPEDPKTNVFTCNIRNCRIITNNNYAKMVRPKSGHSQSYRFRNNFDTRRTVAMFVWGNINECESMIKAIPQSPDEKLLNDKIIGVAVIPFPDALALIESSKDKLRAWR